MARPPTAGVPGAAMAVKRFAIEHLEVRILRDDCPQTLNLDVEFISFLTFLGVDPLTAAEWAEEQRTLVRRKVNELIERWTRQGVRAPLAFAADREDIVLSWRHRGFAEQSGNEPPDAGIVGIYRWLERQRQAEFLLPCVCFLKTVGCDPIYVTDGSRDEGIDCIGLIASGALRSTAVFVQAKSNADQMGGELLLQEYAKYAAMQRTAKYLQYLDALGVPRTPDGAGYLYAILSNSDFHYSARQHAYRLGALLRSRRQLAHALSTVFSVEELEVLKAGCQIPQGADLTTNVAGRLSL